MGTKIRAVLVLFVLILAALSCYSQDLPVSGATKGPLDTVAYQTAQRSMHEAEGVYEKEIDPKMYYVGPGDDLTVSFISAHSRLFNLTVSPEGKLLIPEAGVVDLKDKTLAEANEIIKQKIKATFKTQDIIILLNQPRKFKIVVAGYVRKPAIVSASGIDRVSEVIERAGGVKPGASIRNIIIQRDGEPKEIKVDLIRYYSLGEKDANPYVRGGDRITVLPADEKSNLEVYGFVASPGKYEYKDGDSLSTLIKIAQGFLPSAYLDSVEIARFVDNSPIIQRSFIDLNSWRSTWSAGTPLPGDFPLKESDRIYVRQTPDWKEPYYAAIGGEVKFPGRYPIGKRNFKVKDLIDRAGGITSNATIEKGMLIRPSSMTYDAEFDRIRKLNQNEMTEYEKNYYRAKLYDNNGVMSIDFRKIIEHPESDDNVYLSDKDTVYIPGKLDYINVQGRVNKPGLVLFKPGFTYKDYVELAGGFGYEADEGAIIVVKSKGERLLAKSNRYILEPGDNILVPPEEEISFKDILTTTAQVLSIIGVILALRYAFK